MSIDPQKLRLEGIYPQRQKDFYMQRIKLPAGVLSANQALKVAEIADRFARGGVHLTTRGSIELHWLTTETLPLVAKWLRVTVPKKAKKISSLDMELYDTIQSEFVEIILPGNSEAVGKAIVKLKLPKPALIVLLVREGKYIQPNGSTVMEEGDKLLVLANNKEILSEVYKSLGV